WLVCDEVYEELVFDGPFESPFDVPEFAEHVIVVSSISKSCAAPGFRSGWAVGPAAFCERVLPLSETMLFGNQPFIADMTTRALTDPPDTARRMRSDYARRARVLFDRLSAVPELTPYRPAAGMFLLADVARTGLDGEAFAWQLLEAGVAVMPGTSFGESARTLIRISLTVPDHQLEEAADRIARFVGELP
ncbi:MAG: pyridoxal phosphate-dependent aminotransferase, partial [Pseudomonadota bacterium]